MTSVIPPIVVRHAPATHLKGDRLIARCEGMQCTAAQDGSLDVCAYAVAKRLARQRGHYAEPVTAGPDGYLRLKAHAFGKVAPGMWALIFID